MKEPQEPFKSGKYIVVPEYKKEVLVNKLYVHPDFIEQFEESFED